jgi:hypothetical protein
MPFPGTQTLPGAGAGGLREDAADPVRGAAANLMARPRIGGFSAYSGCVDSTASATNTLRIRGMRFGSEQGSRDIMIVLPIRHSRVRAAYVQTWSDNEIRVELPRPGGEYQPGRPYQLVILDNGSVASNYSDRFEVCHTAHRVSGDITLLNCNADPADLTVVAQGGRYSRRYTRRPAVSPRSDFMFAYSFDDLPSGDYSVSIEMNERRCPGGTWLPVQRRVSLDHHHAAATADFRYGVDTTSVPIPIELVRGLLNEKLAGTRIYINNYPGAAALSGDTPPIIRWWHVRHTPDSVIQIPESAGGFQRSFPMEVFRHNPFTYYINDIGLDSLNVVALPDGLRLDLQFETNGKELIKECHNDALCELGGDIEMALSIQVFFTLERYVPAAPGVPGISIGNIRVVATPNAQMLGVCNVSFLDPVCQALVGYKRQIKAAIEENVTNVLNDRRVKDSIYSAMRPTLDGLGIGRVESVSISGGRNYVIRHTPPVRD